MPGDGACVGEPHLAVGSLHQVLGRRARPGAPDLGRAAGGVEVADRPAGRAGEDRPAAAAGEPDRADGAGGQGVGVRRVAGQRVGGPAVGVRADVRDGVLRGRAPVLAPHRAVGGLAQDVLALGSVGGPAEGLAGHDPHDAGLVIVHRDPHGPVRRDADRSAVGSLALIQAVDLAVVRGRIDAHGLAPVVVRHPHDAVRGDVEVLHAAVDAAGRGGRQRELLDLPGRRDPADLVGVLLDEPHVPVRSGGDPSQPGGAGRDRVHGDRGLGW